MNKPQHTSPCKDCPFSRGVAPGSLGGSAPEMYVGQANGPFFLPCHSTHNYRVESERINHENPQCAGAAIFRANTDRAKLMPDALLHLPADTTKVFATFAEFYAHHLRCSVSYATKLLEKHTPEQHMMDEFNKKKAKVLLVPKKEKP
jgi:hypothetical protein